jgi:ribonucleoside-diphosphate reductase alpha chain
MPSSIRDFYAITRKQTTNEDFSIEEVKLPVKRVEADTVEDTLTANAYHNILPARYLQKDEDGSLIEEPAGLFKRVARNVALADSVYQAEDAGYEITATPADTRRAFMEAYEQGGKGITYYRDGTRSKQVVTTRADNQATDEEEAVEQVRDQIEEGQIDVEELGIDVSEEINTGELGSVSPQTRPKSLTGTTKKLSTGYGDLFVTINEVDEGQPFEVFANIGKSGAYTESFTESTARLISLCLRCGIEPEDVIEQIEGIRSPKVSWDKGDQVYSVPDGIALAMRRYIDEKSETFESEETGVEKDSTGSKSSREVIDAGENPECPDCGSLSLYYSEGCKTCEECGWSEC